ncbi:pre-rRNA-processing protein pno1 [Tilletia horrida]|uniref:Pre-rRNA-processing protein PNO1 n=1 Tax=Tilletia horrida TaxID=155126 RepID=A0AAN6GKK2_9BASI|nr:pre-rRNA-processing protein pno1 [Tilletia horrida]
MVSSYASAAASSKPTTSSLGARATKPAASAKQTLLGSSKKNSKSDNGDGDDALPQRKPFGQEGSDDDDEDDDADLVFEDARDDDDDLMITDAVQLVSTSGSLDTATAAAGAAGSAASDPAGKPLFAALGSTSASSAVAGASSSSSSSATALVEKQERKIPIPPHRLSPLKRDWPKIYTPLVEMANLQVRMNVKRHTVELRSSKHTLASPAAGLGVAGGLGMLQRGADFVKAYALGFDVDDAIALLRMDDLFVDTFEIKDVKTLHGDHLSRAIGRIAGKDGRTRYAIENASRTRVVLADTKIHILGSFQNIRIARDAIVSLIMGSPPGKVYANLKTIGARQRQRA